MPYLMIGRVSEENLRHLYNPLTSLWNKVKLRTDLKEKLPAGKGYLLLLDIDGLSAINLSHGREYGDSLLKEIAELCDDLSPLRRVSAIYAPNIRSITIPSHLSNEPKTYAAKE